MGMAWSGPQPQARPATAGGTLVDMQTPASMPAGATWPDQGGIPSQGQQPAPVVSPATPQGPQASPVQAPKNRTMLGMAPPNLAAAAQERIGNRTMLGVPGPAAQPGYPPPNAPAAPQAQYQAQPQQAQPQQAQPQHQTQARTGARTMLGVAMPGIAPTHDRPPEPAVPSQQPSQNRTMMGVAMPGIAPTNEPARWNAPPAAPAPEPVYQHQLQPPPQPPPEPLQPLKRPRAVVASTPLYRRPAFIFTLLGVTVAVVVALFALLWPTKPPITSQATVNNEGKDVLRLQCEGCPDGTVMTVDGQKATSSGGTADIALARPLSVGENRFTVQIDRPGSGRDESVELIMPVAFRVRPDLAELDSDKPTFHVEVETTAGASILVGGTALQPGPDGKARFAVDVTEECRGESAEVTTIDKTIPYTIQPKGGAASSGSVAVKVGVTPLTLQSPRPHAVLDAQQFLVAGRTARGATVEIEGAKFAASDDGSFSRKMQIKRDGETQVHVRAKLPDHAPRIMVFTVKRVVDLEAEAKAFEAKTTVDMNALMRDSNSQIGKQIVLRGEVVEARTQGYVRIVLLDTGGKCDKPPCLIRLVYAGTEALGNGDKVRVFGHVAGAQTAGPRTVPDVDVDFMIKVR